MSSFAAWLEDRMRERGWNATTLEREFGISDATTSRVLRGSKPKPPNVVKYAKAFGADIPELMRLAGYPVGDPSDPAEDEKLLLTQVRAFPWLQDLVPDIAALSPRNQAVVRDLVKSLRRQEGDDVE
jgi:hypothetical protein